MRLQAGVLWNLNLASPLAQQQVPDASLELSTLKRHRPRQILQ
jgi:hypothetical protein